ncbi:MAG: hypothetical protein ACOX6U_07210 [Oscillospiraceae bacterium]|jgi:hypothetical protein
MKKAPYRIVLYGAFLAMQDIEKVIWADKVRGNGVGKGNGAQAGGGAYPPPQLFQQPLGSSGAHCNQRGLAVLIVFYGCGRHGGCGLYPIKMVDFGGITELLGIVFKF